MTVRLKYMIKWWQRSRIHIAVEISTVYQVVAFCCSSDFVYIRHNERLPPNSFTSFDAVNWSLKKQFGLCDTSGAVDVFEVCIVPHRTLFTFVCAFSDILSSLTSFVSETAQF